MGTVIINNKTSYTLSRYKYWGTSWTNEPPTTILSQEIGVSLDLFNNNGRSGIVYLARDSSGNEMGFATMSFTFSSSSGSSAEGGSPKLENKNVFIPSGLQRYDKRASFPARIIYNIGTKNEACWKSGSSDDGIIECPQTNMEEWTRVFLCLQNTLPFSLDYIGYWNNNWVKSPESIPKASRCHGMTQRIFLLNDYNPAGIYYEAAGLMPFHMSFICPKVSFNCAEGSAYCGLQNYEKHGKAPVCFTFKIGTKNKACWDNGSKYYANIVCEQTKVHGVSATWMNLLMNRCPSFATKQLWEVFWPGTHDSCCYNITFPFASPLVQTQYLSFEDQLKAGIRYFDLRLKWISSTEFRFNHGGWNTNVYLKDLLDALTSYFTEDMHAHEIVILDFTHFDAESFNTLEKYQEFIDTLLGSAINNRFAPQGSSTDTLNSLWTANKNIIASIDHPLFERFNTQSLLWNGRNLFAFGWSGTKFWPNTHILPEMIIKLEKLLKNNYDGKLWTLQNILTPNFPHLSIFNLSLEANPSFFSHLEVGTSWFEKSNIVILDYVDVQFAIYALYVNWKRSSHTVK